MEIICGKDIFNVKDIASVHTYKASYAELKKLEIIYNGSIVGAEQHNHGRYSKNHESLSLIERKVQTFLKSSELEFLVGKIDAYRSENCFEICKVNKISGFDASGDALIFYTKTIYYKIASIGSKIYKSELSLLNDIIPYVKTNTNISNSIREMFNEYLKFLGDKQKQIDFDLNRLAKRDEFLKKYEGKSVLKISFTSDAKKDRKYLEDRCGFDIFQKEQEIYQALRTNREEQQKQQNTDNSGEKAVEYALKWCKVTICDAHLVSITNDCTSKYRDNCILLCKPSFIDEPQEYDHILVCCAGVILLETKHWNGTVIIRPDGKWTRIPEHGATVTGIDSPRFQIRRHAVLMGEILPDVPIYNILCFSNSSTIIEGMENFKDDYRIVRVDQLEETIDDICRDKKYNQEEINHMVAVIENHKVKKV